MINKKIESAINGQIQAELYSSYLYLAMSAYCQSLNFKGFAHWLKMQAEEEVEHALKFYNFLLDRGGTVELLAIQKPPVSFVTPAKAFSQAYGHEQKVTGLINKLYELARQEKDYAFEQLLHWFIDEQVEEEAQTQEISEILAKLGGKGNGIWMLDHRLGKRKGE
ncbi:ferritin [Patescibacteria group bacterium]|nr:ferritin [Patescibacteria group bacterium]MBU0964432.1 ferritin [Patescibacteria group bacterium]